MVYGLTTSRAFRGSSIDAYPVSRPTSSASALARPISAHGQGRAGHGADACSAHRLAMRVRQMPEVVRCNGLEAPAPLIANLHQTGIQRRGSSRYSRCSSAYNAGASSANACGRSKKDSVATAKNSTGSVPA